MHMMHVSPAWRCTSANELESDTSQLRHGTDPAEACSTALLSAHSNSSQRRQVQDPGSYSCLPKASSSRQQPTQVLNPRNYSCLAKASLTALLSGLSTGVTAQNPRP